MFKVQREKIYQVQKKKLQGFLCIISQGSGGIRGSGDITAHPF